MIGKGPNHDVFVLFCIYLGVTCKVISIFFNGLAIVLYKPPPPGTEVSFQSQNVVVSTISVEEDLHKAENEG